MRSFHATRSEAESVAEKLMEQIRTSGEAWVSLSVREREKLIRVWREAQEAGLDLFDLVRAAKAAAPPSDVTLETAINDVVAVAIESRRTARYVKDLKGALGRFARGRQVQPITQISPQDIQSWLANPKWSDWTRRTYRQRLESLFAHALKHGWINHDPMAKVPSVVVRQYTPCIFTVDQHKACLEFLEGSPRLLAWYVLSTMCGLRPEEAEQSTWESINFDEQLIRVEGQTSKRRLRRIVYPLPQALDWLRHAKAIGSELPLGWQKRRIDLDGLKALLKWERWPQDITRHTAASYWLAQTGDAIRLSRQLGHSVTTMEQRYLALVTRAEAERFWSISPRG